MAKINYADKQDFRTTATSANKKVTAADMNEIKESVNALYDLAPEKKVYKALLTQSGTNAPVATVLENTLGKIVWTRNNIGDYLATLPNTFPQNKTWYQTAILSKTSNESWVELMWDSIDGFSLSTGSSNVASDDMLNYTPITIEVYP